MDRPISEGGLKGVIAIIGFDIGIAARRIRDDGRGRGGDLQFGLQRINQGDRVFDFAGVVRVEIRVIEVAGLIDGVGDAGEKAIA